MKCNFFLKVLLLAGPFVFGQINLNYTANQTPTYSQVIAAYQKLANTHPNAQLVEVGTTDSGRPLHLFLMQRQAFTGQENLQQLALGKTVVLINNGIHPGESCGIDASIILAEKALGQDIAPNQLVAIVPVYNVGGALNRGSFSRANQNGPQAHGFRGNAQNLDLNRDFVKAEALNTKSFFALFQALQPHIFIDTHTSNGADYQYTLSLISTQQDKLAAPLAQLMTQSLEPFLYKNMAKSGWELTPYVNVFGRTPNDGMAAFLETPRYASGYTALFNTIGFITEAHMLKPYANRVESTFQFLELILQYAAENGPALEKAREQAFALDAQKKHYATQWTLDSSQVQPLNFKGYAYRYEPSALGNYQRLKYLKNKPETFTVNYYPNYRATDSAAVPQYFVIPQAYRKVVERLQYQNIVMQRLTADTTMAVSSTYITQHAFAQRAYEGKHPLKSLTTKTVAQQRQFLAGDYLIPTQQKNLRFLMAVLPATAVDSYLRWNFFDIIFQQKEHFSAYVFEETAAALLAKDEDLQKRFALWKEENPALAANNYACLSYLYKNSKYYEKEHLRYPVAQIF
jgi:hypothetical protein